MEGTFTIQSISVIVEVVYYKMCKRIFDVI